MPKASPSKKLAAQLRTLRLARGFTQARVADAVGLAQNSYSELESGATAPRLPVLVKLARLYGIPRVEAAFPMYRLSADERLVIQHYVERGAVA